MSDKGSPLTWSSSVPFNELSFDLEVVQEPARGMWFVQDNENPEVGVMFGPVGGRARADAWVEGFNDAIERIEEER